MVGSTWCPLADIQSFLESQQLAKRFGVRGNFSIGVEPTVYPHYDLQADDPVWQDTVDYWSCGGDLNAGGAGNAGFLSITNAAVQQAQQFADVYRAIIDEIWIANTGGTSIQVNFANNPNNGGTNPVIRQNFPQPTATLSQCGNILFATGAAAALGGNPIWCSVTLPTLQFYIVRPRLVLSPRQVFQVRAVTTNVPVSFAVFGRGFQVAK
jgi:hypothetical protein